MGSCGGSARRRRRTRARHRPAPRLLPLSLSRCRSSTWPRSRASSAACAPTASTCPTPTRRATTPAGPELMQEMLGTRAGQHAMNDCMTYGYALLRVRQQWDAPRHRRWRRRRETCSTSATSPPSSAAARNARSSPLWGSPWASAWSQPSSRYPAGSMSARPVDWRRDRHVGRPADRDRWLGPQGELSPRATRRGQRRPPPVMEAIKADPRLTPRQRQSMLEIYEALTREERRFTSEKR